MSKSFLSPLPLGLFALCVILTVPALAQTAPPQTAAPAQDGAWTSQNFNRQEFREEMQAIRKEHEDIAASREQMRSQCASPQGAQVAQCEQEKQSLRAEHEQLRGRVQALREKMQAMHMDGAPNRQMGAPNSGQAIAQSNGAMFAPATSH